MIIDYLVVWIGIRVVRSLSGSTVRCLPYVLKWIMTSCPIIPWTDTRNHLNASVHTRSKGTNRHRLGNFATTTIDAPI